MYRVFLCPKRGFKILKNRSWSEVFCIVTVSPPSILKYRSSIISTKMIFEHKIRTQFWHGWRGTLFYFFFTFFKSKRSHGHVRVGFVRINRHGERKSQKMQNLVVLVREGERKAIGVHVRENGDRSRGYFQNSSTAIGVEATRASPNRTFPA